MGRWPFNPAFVLGANGLGELHSLGNATLTIERLLPKAGCSLRLPHILPPGQSRVGKLCLYPYPHNFHLCLYFKGFSYYPLLLFYLVLFLSSLGCVRDFISLLLLFLRQGLTYPKLALNSLCA